VRIGKVGMGRTSHDKSSPAGDHVPDMRVDRGYLFWGIFFVLLGAIPLADREGWIEVGGLGDIWRLWPLVLIGIGAAILFSRTSMGLIVTIVAAVILGALAGAAISSIGGGGIGGVFDCVGTSDRELARTTRDGTLQPGGDVRVRLDCGDLAVTTTPGTGWTLDAGHAGDPPRVVASTSDLDLQPADGTPRRQDWRLVLPPALGTLAVDTNAASATLALDGADVDRFEATVNAGDLHLTAPTGDMSALQVDVNAGSVDVLAPSVDIGRLDVQANAGSVELSLGGSVTGEIDGTAMSVQLCVPATASLAITTGDDFGFSHDLQARGLTHSGDVWQRAGSGPRITLTVGGTASSLTLDDEGGCR
jgi:hypothetical protein